VVFDTSRLIVTELMGRAALAHEMVGWQYHHDRDLTGFEDGTENPSIVEAASVALVPTGLPGEGASILLLQQWEHDAIAWEALPVASQEAIIGRRKSDSQELDPRPTTSHVTRTDQDRFGKIFRRNVAYGTMSQHGTIFVGFCGSQTPFVQMLESMVGSESEPPDELTSVARAVTGAYYIIPTADRLSALGAEDRL
jgi:putative iron-dependent peroxidase